MWLIALTIFFNTGYAEKTCEHWMGPGKTWLGMHQARCQTEYIHVDDLATCLKTCEERDDCTKVYTFVDEPMTCARIHSCNVADQDIIFSDYDDPGTWYACNEPNEQPWAITREPTDVSEYAKKSCEEVSGVGTTVEDFRKHCQYVQIANRIVPEACDELCEGLEECNLLGATQINLQDPGDIQCFMMACEDVELKFVPRAESTVVWKKCKQEEPAPVPEPSTTEATVETTKAVAEVCANDDDLVSVEIKDFCLGMGEKRCPATCETVMAEFAVYSPCSSLDMPWFPDACPDSCPDSPVKCQRQSDAVVTCDQVTEMIASGECTLPTEPVTTEAVVTDQPTTAAPTREQLWQVEGADRCPLAYKLGVWGHFGKPKTTKKCEKKCKSHPDCVAISYKTSNRACTGFSSCAFFESTAEFGGNEGWINIRVKPEPSTSAFSTTFQVEEPWTALRAGERAFACLGVLAAVVLGKKALDNSKADTIYLQVDNDL